MRFETALTYNDRKSKARYVWSKYEGILTGSVLDVGVDSERGEHTPSVAWPPSPLVRRWRMRERRAPAPPTLG